MSGKGYARKPTTDRVLVWNKVRRTPDGTWMISVDLDERLWGWLHRGSSV